MIVAVLVAAHAAERFIGECLRSIEQQNLPVGWDMSVRVGVDASWTTSAAIDESHWYSKTRVGPYVMRNSLMAIDGADAYAPFDADDVMLPGYLATLLNEASGNGIAGSRRADIKEDGTRNGKAHKFVSGVCVFSAEAMAKLGGYRPWPVAADFDIIMRAQANGIPLRRVDEVLYLRRRHPGSLTNSAEYGMDTDARMDLMVEARRLTEGGEFFVEPVTVPLTLVSGVSNARLV